MRRIYLNVCCLNRRFDDQEQDRVHLEAEMVRFLQQSETGWGNYTEGRHQWLGDPDLRTLAREIQSKYPGNET